MDFLSFKTPLDSFTTMSELVMPDHTNMYGNLMGGKLMYWMDVAAGITALKHCNSQVVTVSVDGLSFHKPAKLGQIVYIESIATRIFSSSIEIYIRVFADDAIEGTRVLTNEAYITFVAIDEHGNSKKILSGIEPQSEIEKQRYKQALLRRKMRFFLDERLSTTQKMELLNKLLNEIE
ncbi:MAG: acyl-CoA thioesterase [Chitinophagaceae bacterium]